MPRRPDFIPPYKLHKRSGRGVVRFFGRDVYFPGPHGSPESRAAYDAFIVRWLTNGRRLPDSDSGPTPPTAGGEPGPGSGPVVAEVILAFLEHADAQYPRREGRRGSEADNFRHALKPAQQLFGELPAREFGPRRLEAVRDAMIASGLARKVINRRIARILQMFDWAVWREMIPPALRDTLRAIPPLRAGRSAARETEPVRPVPDEHVDAIEPHVARAVWAMVQIQRFTGCRPGEVVAMRGADLDTGGEVWTYAPPDHKNAWRGKARVVVLGPRAQDVLRPWLRPDPSEFLFQPREMEAERVASLRAARKTPVQPSQRDRSKPDPKRKPRDRYDTNSYARAIRRGCEKAGVPPWGPHRLRHSAATRIRAEIDLETARAVLGHATLKTTEIYAEADRRKAAEAMLRIG